QAYPGIRSGLSVPIVLQSGVFGVLAAFSTAPRRFTRDDLHFVEAIANVLGNALDRNRSREALAESEQRYRQIVETAQEAIWTVDAEGRFTLANQNAAEMFGRSLEELLASSIFDVVPPAHHEEVRVSLERRREGLAETFDWSVVREDGERWVSLSLSPLLREDGTFDGALAMSTDITDRKQAEGVLVHRTLHDGLTGLPNRMLLHDRVAQAIAAAKRENMLAAVIFIDLDGFKEINDTFGHHQGDALLCQVGPRLRGVMRESDTIARLGGDEFAVVLAGINDVDEATTIAGRMLKGMEAPFSVGDAQVEVTGSIGIAVCPQHGEDVTALLQHADAAMYVAKRQKNSYAVFAGQKDNTSTNRLVLAAELRRAIELDGLRLLFQPKVSLATGNLIGVEALARWPHPTRGMVLPDEFIPAAETTGLIRALSQWVIRAALCQLRGWRDKGIDLTAAVNLSMRDLRDPHLSDHIMSLLDTFRVDPTWLSIEITETMIMADPKQTLEVVRRLHDMGLAFCIDDFGTGYSSLSYLRDLPADEIKIDKSFVLGMLTDESDAAIVRSVIDLAHNLGRVTVAEGVESREVWETLSRLGCDVAQGYYVGRPMDHADFCTWLTDRAGA
ncbi:MAG: EAL domain-containing protein, partial [Chloroflexota bacterium]|nr:EAL domain-containing protein [Chloroflexota bacterium]